MIKKRRENPTLAQQKANNMINPTIPPNALNVPNVSNGHNTPNTPNTANQ